MNIVVLSWVRAEKYCEESGDPIDTALNRIRSGEWAANPPCSLAFPMLRGQHAEIWGVFGAKCKIVVACFAQQSIITTSTQQRQGERNEEGNRLL